MNPVRKEISARTTRGFTLLELLVVMSIIAILAGLIIPNLMGSKIRAKISATKVELHEMDAALEGYYIVFGDYPPTSLTFLKKNTYVNSTNQGIESLVACLASQNKGGPFLLKWSEDRYTNLDNDKSSRNLTNWFFGDNQLRELVDCWQNPFVYFHSRDYELANQYSKYLDKRKKEFVALPQKSSKLKTWHNRFTYQLWSLGPNEKNDNGVEDDIPNW